MAKNNLKAHDVNQKEAKKRKDKRIVKSLWEEFNRASILIGQNIVNFDIPKDVHSYLHRIGRSGRWGRKGVGINFITRRDVFKMKELEEYYACEINPLPENLETIMR